MENRQTMPAKELTEEERRMLIGNYFKINHVELPSFTKGRILLVYAFVFLGIMLMFYLKKAVPTLIFCTGCFVFAFWQFYLFIRPYFHERRLFAKRPLEEDMCSWLIKDLKEVVKPKAIETLSLNMSDVRPENFIIIPVPIYWEAPGINPDDILRSPLSDGSYIYTYWRVQIIVLTKHFISLFKCNYNWPSNTMSSLSTNEFYFQDITSIRNDLREIEFSFVDNAEQPIGPGKVFCVTNFSGEYLTVINDIPSLQGPKVVSVNLEYMVSLLRMVIRNRRFGITHEEVTKEESAVVDSAADNTGNAQGGEMAEDGYLESVFNSHDDMVPQQESQFGDVPASSFGNSQADIDIQMSGDSNN